MMLTNLATVLRAAGLKVAEESGWETRGHSGPRHAGGDFGVGLSGNPKTIVCHHTGGLKDLRVIIDGRPGLSGPLANIWLAQDGTWHVTAAGMCYHAGVVRDLSYANEWSIGIEAEATGVDAWPDVQYQSYAKGCAALCEAFGLHPSRVLGHKEVCEPAGRKNDPNFSMFRFRDLVEHYLLPPPLEVPEVITAADRTAIAQEAADLVVEKLIKKLELTTGWNSDGTFDRDPANAETVPFKKAIAEIRGATLAMANGKPFAQ